MWGIGIDHRYATRDELKEVHEGLKKNEQCLNKLQDSVIEIKSGIGLAKWFFVTALAMVPVITTVLSYVKDNVAPTQNTKPQQIYVLPDGTQIPKRIE